MDGVYCQECRSRRPSLLVRLFRGGSAFLDQDWLCSPRCLRHSLANLVSRTLAYPVPEVDSHHRMRIGTMLAIKGLINSEQLGTAIQKQAIEGGTIGSHILELGYCTPAQLTSALSEQQGVPWVGEVKLSGSRELARLMPARLCGDFSVFPFDFDEETKVVHVAAKSPVRIALFHMLRKMVGYQVKAFIVSDESFAGSFEEYLSTCDPERESVVECSRDFAEIADSITSEVIRFRAQSLKIVAYDDAFWVRLQRRKHWRNIIVRLEKRVKTAHSTRQNLPTGEEMAL